MVREYLLENVLLTDGAMGTYYSEITGDNVSKCEFANLKNPEVIEGIHKEYIDAGAKLIRTNTFAANSITLGVSKNEVKKIIQEGYKIARKVAENKDVFVGASIGPIPEPRFDDEEFDLYDEYIYIVDSFLEVGADIFVFETFSSLDYLKKVISYIRQRNSNAFILTQFSFTMDGFTRRGLSLESVLSGVKLLDVDAYGFNCGLGPMHLYKILKGINMCSSIVSALPNAGYPDIINERSVYVNNPDYFADMMVDIESLGVKIIGGCCGTTPKHISKIKEKLEFEGPSSFAVESVKIAEKKVNIEKTSAFSKKVSDGNFVIAVELDPPFGVDISGIIDGAKLCKEIGVDLITVADSPRALARVDSLMVATKIKREVGIDVLPHICCRDKNINAIRSGLLASHIEGTRNILAVTGDPISEEDRVSTKSVFNLNSFRLIELIEQMNKDVFQMDKIAIGGALNLNVTNKEAEIKRMDKKIEKGASFFLTQPIFDQEVIDYLINLKKDRKDAKILAGIMPLVSYRNAMFLHNEVPGILIPEECINKFNKDMTKEEGYEVGVEIAASIANKLKPYVDGFYFITPFNRVEVVKRVIDKIN
ncbi:bifunctional homocysteine S-methyltransferase/methylenetetrahydrofolate reductase [Clostridium cylindrosporum]|uniref:Bifunctional homocysteine S-methyltransferase/5,10-methylenetetrahydrofolate reductase n=1 Tax=Clostridium cylindrosporum DSM 605 TaxID=1121307 RepID=A0A0J8DG11_CLOCY|nr:bifunctional homocysteine S-methyltransferase/methylenetetrahydrofolate reductase [Clostridium cylindrosporum]KMT23174.1 bifunctional homocysteine S-methyltransferase/5,10-methylenetetrahydrofolate reductase [Clostridium cylindrosporum DSM 605]